MSAAERVAAVVARLIAIAIAFIGSVVTALLLLIRPRRTPRPTDYRITRGKDLDGRRVH
jgi:hypothetical protein